MTDGVLRYRIVAAPPPPLEAVATAAYGVECLAYGEEPEEGGEASRSGDVVCSLQDGHDPEPHWDGWDRTSWELVR